VTKPKLTYFDMHASRGEECRLALHCAGVEFEDNRINRDTWMSLKANSPFGGLPLFEIPGKPVLAQSNAVLVYIGREYGLHPKDNFEAARHEGLLAHGESLREEIGRTLRMPDAEKKAVREQLAASYIPTWATYAERALTGDGPFVGGDKLSVVDIKLHVIVRWLARGTVDHIPATVFDAYPRLTRLSAAVGEHPGVKSWRARTNQQ
jgi:prostaglandin-H2 D-isomerase / glutathione transferase